MLLKALNGESTSSAATSTRSRTSRCSSRTRSRRGLKFFEIVDASPNYMTRASQPDAHEPGPARDLLEQGLPHRPEHARSTGRRSSTSSSPARASPTRSRRGRNRSSTTRSSASSSPKYDVEKANKYLDKAGYAKKDGEGFRLGPDGKPHELHHHSARGPPGDGGYGAARRRRTGGPSASTRSSASWRSRPTSTSATATSTTG